jgi:hypothetical protein
MEAAACVRAAGVRLSASSASRCRLRHDARCSGDRRDNSHVGAARLGKSGRDPPHQGTAPSSFFRLASRALRASTT